MAGPGPDHWVREVITIKSIARKMGSVLTINVGTYK